MSLRRKYDTDIERQNAKSKSMKKWRLSKSTEIQKYSTNYYSNHRDDILKKASDRAKRLKIEGRVREASSYNSIRTRAGYMWRAAQNRAAKLGIPFCITKDDVAALLSNLKCQVTGVELRLDNPTPYRRDRYAPSLDRHIPNLGYTKENTRIVSTQYNLAKQEWTDEDVLEMAKILCK